LYEELIISGFGGQGVLVAGKLLARAAMEQGRQVTYMPSYGPEVRGGTANCMVVIADEPVACPIVAQPDALIAMNQASVDRFGPKLKPGGLLVLNRSMIQNLPGKGDCPPSSRGLSPLHRNDIEIVAVPADELAIQLGSPRSANMAALGAYLQRRGIMSPETVGQCLTLTLAKRHHDTIAVNQQAINAGARFVREQ
jgi:2-oxoglutarate ferredoxin oxidoreductase subunit gamma